MLVAKLNRYRHEYYNKAKPSVSDAVYDHLFDELLKLDGLTIKLCYENGQLAEASTRGDGDVGEVITHNTPAFHNVPTSIPHKGRLVIMGEGFIHKDDFEKMKVEVLGKENKTACNARNLIGNIFEQKFAFYVQMKVIMIR